MSDINKSIKRRKRQHNMLKYEIICFNDETNEIIMQIKDDEKFDNFCVFLIIPIDILKCCPEGGQVVRLLTKF